MKNKRLIFFALIMIAGISVLFLNCFHSSNYGDNKASFSRLFQSAGKITHAASRGAGRLLPVNSIDEGKLGAEIKQRYRHQVLTDENKQISRYLNELLKIFNWKKINEFDYEIFLVDAPSANAYAMPGGVIIVTKGLLDVVESEAELVFIIGHEIGHIELSHCFNMVKYKLASQKILKKDIGTIIDTTSQIVLRSSYSKTHEAEADMYGFELLIAAGYNPSASYKAFENLHKNDRFDIKSKTNILTDYFRSHPPLKERINKYKAESKIWWQKHNGEKRYIGVENLKQRKTFPSQDFGVKEWIDKFN